MTERTRARLPNSVSETPHSTGHDSSKGPWPTLASLFTVHAFNSLVPLVTLPYLARVLGPEAWGALAFTEAYVRNLIIMIEYGFNLSATRAVARMRSNPFDRASLLSGVLGAQLLLTLVAVLMTFVLTHVSAGFASLSSLMPSALWWAASQAIVPLWYFQGIGRIRLISILNITANVISALGIVLYVHSSEDIRLVFLFRGATLSACAIAAVMVAYQNTPTVGLSLQGSVQALREGWFLFLFRSAVTLYTTSNVLVLGLLASPAVVAWFAGGEKIARAAINSIQPIAQTFYPRINQSIGTDNKLAAKELRLSAILTIGAGVCIGLFLFCAAPILVRTLLGSGFGRSITVLRLLSVLPPLVAISNVLGIQWMLPLQMERLFNRILLLAGIGNLLLAVVLAPRYYEIGMAISVIVADTIVTAGIILTLHASRVRPWANWGLNSALLEHKFENGAVL